MSKYILGSIFVLSIMGAPLFANAYHSKPTRPIVPPVSTTTPTGICINYGYQQISSSGYNLTQAAKDLAALKADNINCVRLAFYGTNSGVTKPLALLAKQAGFYVVIGNDGNPTSAGYSSGVIAEASWAQANHIDQVSIGNEAAKNTTTQQDLSALSCQVRMVYGGAISYDTYLATSGFDDIRAWAQNPGCLSKLGLNIYANYANTAKEAQQYLGQSKWYVSEVNEDCDAGLCNNDVAWASGLSKDLSTLRPFGVQEYVFAYNAGGDGVATHWGMSTHPSVMAVVK